MSRETEQQNPSPSSGKSMLWVGTALFIVGIAAGAWGAIQFFTPKLPNEPTFAADQPAPSQDDPTSPDPASPVQPVPAQPGTTRSLRMGAAPAPLIPAYVSQIKRRPLRYEGPIKLTDAILLNGGGSAQSNYFSHHLHIRMLRELLVRRGLPAQQISIFSSDGQDSSPDQLISKSTPLSWLFKGSQEEQLVNSTKLINTVLKGHKMHPARRNVMKRELRKLARRIRRRKKPSTVLLFVTDHGTPGKGPLGNKIELWNQQLDVRQLRDMLRPIGRKHRVISVMSQCYSGGFANLMYTRRWKVQGNRCGFFSTLSTREAYGCFPETARANRVGHAYRMIRAMRDARTFAEAHNRILLMDQTPDVPLATSDVYLEDVMRKAARRRRTNKIRLIDRTLKSVWRRRPRDLRADIKMLSHIKRRFQLPNHRYLRTVWRDIRANRRKLKKIERLDQIWKQVWQEVQRGSMVNFYRKHKGIASAVEREFNRPQVDAQTRRVGRRLHRALGKYIRTHKNISKRMKRLYKRFDQVQKQIHLLHTYEAALLRVATRLTRIAGRYYLKRRGRRAQKRSLQRLMRCEATPIRGRAFRKELRAEGPGAKGTPQRPAKRASLASLTPSRLGIGFGQAPSSWNPSFAKTAPGAVRVNEVMPGSPAANAGIQVGDVIAAIGGQMLQLENEIRDLVMLSPANKNIFFMVYRNGRFRTIPVRLQRMGGAVPNQPAPPKLGRAPRRMRRAPDPQGRSFQQPPSFNDPNGGMGNSQPGFKGINPWGSRGFQNNNPSFDDFGHGGGGNGGWDDEPDTRVYGLPKRKSRRARPNRRRAPAGASNLQDINGNAITFPAKQGVTLLFFWATWCEGCKAMVPSIIRLQRRFRGKKLKLLAVTTDTPAMLRPFKRKWGARFPFKIAVDRGGALSRRYGVSTIPALLMFSSDGKLLFRSGHLNALKRRRLFRLINRYGR